MANPRKQQIIDATQTVLAQEGLKAVTMRRVAKEVGISAPSIYRHFADRDALVQAVIAQGSQLLGTYLFKALELDTPAEQLAATGLQYLRFALEHETIFGLMFAAWNELSIPAHAPAADHRSSGLQLLIDRVAACLAGERRKEVLLEHALEQWAVVHGLATLYLYGGGRQMMPQEQFQQLSEQIIRRAAKRLADKGGSQ